MKRIIGLILFLPMVVLAQNKSIQFGKLPVQNFIDKEYLGQAQVNDVEVDTYGKIYVGHNGGVSVFDGAKWTNLDFNSENQISVTDILISRTGKIYIGGEKDFGFFESDNLGRLTYHSLINLLQEDSLFGPISNIVENEEVVIFQSFHNILVFKDDIIKSNYSKNGFSGIFNAQNRIFISEIKVGLHIFENGKIVAVNNIENTKNIECYDIISFGKDSILITEKNSVYVSSVKNINLTKIDLNIPESVSVQKAFQISLNNYIIGVSPLGSIRINRKLEVIEFLNVKTGLLSDLHSGYCLTSDAQLIISTHNGISFVSINSPIKKIGTVNNFMGNVEKIKGSADKIAVLGKEGVHLLNDSSYFFNKINNKGFATFDGGFIETNEGDKLYLSMNDGLYEVLNNSIDRIDYSYSFDVFQYPFNKKYVFIGLNEGFSIYKINKSKLEIIETIELKESVLDIECNKDGVLWFSTSNGIIKYNPKCNPNSIGKNNEIVKINSSNSEIPDGKAIVKILDKRIVIGTTEGLFEYEEKNNNVSRATNFGEYINTNKNHIHLLSVDKLNQLWIEFVFNDNEREIGYVTESGEWHNEEFTSVANGFIYSIYHDNIGRTWLGGTDGLYLYQNIKNKSPDFKTVLTKISQSDSILHGGYSEFNSSNIIYNYSPNALIFEFGCTNFKDVKNTKFSYYLEGFDEKSDWSEWSRASTSNYTNLHEGNYIFHAKSKNSAGVIGENISFQFSISPPWYRTWWFRVLIVLTLGLILYFLFRMRVKALKQRQVELENTVEERTTEVVEQKHEAEKQRDLAEDERAKTEVQKEIVEEKNREITDSINYAKRIQEAILPPPRLVKEWLTDSFLFYRPKDIVAGDFYWMETLQTEINDKQKTLIFFAAADCTGHGVPGALVSVVCANALNRAVKEFKLSTPGLVLDKVTELVTASFEQSDEDIKDGMDIALCALDLSAKKLYYSGANNPLYIIRPIKGTTDNKYVSSDGSVELIEYKGTKQAIGLTDHVKVFETIEIQLEPGDAMYIFSDGFADQFGGERGKKYKYANFKNFLLENSAVPMEEQKKRLTTEFDVWKRDLEQLDDVCVIGVRINGKERNNYTKRELEVLEYVRDGLSSKLIADKMDIAKSTVDTYRRRLLAKSGTYNAQELINYAIKKEII